MENIQTKLYTLRNAREESIESMVFACENNHPIKIIKEISNINARLCGEYTTILHQEKPHYLGNINKDYR